MQLNDFKMGGWTLLAGWIFPSLVFLNIFTIIILPRFEGLTHNSAVSDLTFPERVLGTTLSAAIIGIVLNALSKPLYRIMEGYFLLPRWFAKKLTTAHSRKRNQLWENYNREAQILAGSISAGLLLEKTSFYPAPGLDVAPTRFSNVLRAAESYGWDRYQLDAVTYWSGLLSSCPEQMKINEERARANVDLFVSSFYLSVLSTASAVMLLFWGHPIPSLVILVGSLISTLASYSFAVSAAKSWGEEIKTIVDSGRVALLQSMGLKKPKSILEEREQWRALGWLRKYPFAESQDSLKGTALWPDT